MTKKRERERERKREKERVRERRKWRKEKKSEFGLKSKYKVNKWTRIQSHGCKSEKNIYLQLVTKFIISWLHLEYKCIKLLA